MDGITRMRHAAYNIEYDHISNEKVVKWAGGIASGEIEPLSLTNERNRLYQRLAEAEFLVSMHELEREGLPFPEELRFNPIPNTYIPDRTR